MAVTKTFNGTAYQIPQNREARGWGTQLSAFLVDVAESALSKSGGSFVLTADVNFGANFGVLSQYFTSRGANPAQSGVFRLANNESIGWRNQANTANLLLKVNASNQLEYNSNQVIDRSDFLDEDNMSSDSATKVASQQSIKAYVDTGLATKVNQTNPTLNGNVSGSGVLDEDNMASDSNVKLATQQSIKAYVDTGLSAKVNQTNPTLNGNVSGTGVLDEDNMASDSNTKLATQQSIKAYVDTLVAPLNYLVSSVSLANLTITDTDKIRLVTVETGSSNRTITLPNPANNDGREIEIVKNDLGTGQVIVSGSIGSMSTVNLPEFFSRITVICDGVEWVMKNFYTPWTLFTPSTTQGFGTISSNNLQYMIDMQTMYVKGYFTAGTVAASEARIGFPHSYSAKEGLASSVGGQFIRANSVANEYQYYALVTNGDTYFNVGRRNSTGSSSGLSPINGDVFSSSERFSVLASCQLTELPLY